MRQSSSAVCRRPGSVISAKQVIVTANSVETPTGQIVAMQGFNNNTSEANAAIELRGLSTPGICDQREAGDRDCEQRRDADGADRCHARLQQQYVGSQCGNRAPRSVDARDL